MKPLQLLNRLVLLVCELESDCITVSLCVGIKSDEATVPWASQVPSRLASEMAVCEVSDVCMAHSLPTLIICAI